LKVKLSIKRSYGDIVIEGEGFEEIINNLKSIPEWLDIVDGLILRAGAPSSHKDLLKGLAEYTAEGIVLTIPREKLSDKESICLLLYAHEPNPLQPKEVARLLTLSGRLSAGFGARLSELRNEGLVVKEGNSYRLSALGRTFVEDMVSRLQS